MLFGFTLGKCIKYNVNYNGIKLPYTRVYFFRKTCKKNLYFCIKVLFIYILMNKGFQFVYNNKINTFFRKKKPPVVLYKQSIVHK